MQFNYLKITARKTELNVLWHSTGFLSDLLVFLSILCVFLCVWVWIKTRQTEETVGFPEWTAQFSVWKTTVKDSSEACAIACQNCPVYLVFPSDVTSHSKIAQFNWECVAPFIMRVVQRRGSDQSTLIEACFLEHRQSSDKCICAQSNYSCYRLWKD